jgi:hypothetical protein
MIAQVAVDQSCQIPSGVGTEQWPAIQVVEHIEDGDIDRGVGHTDDGEAQHGGCVAVQVRAHQPALGMLAPIVPANGILRP